MNTRYASVERYTNYVHKMMKKIFLSCIKFFLYRRCIMQSIGEKSIRD